MGRTSQRILETDKRMRRRRVVAPLLRRAQHERRKGASGRAGSGVVWRRVVELSGLAVSGLGERINGWPFRMGTISTAGRQIPRSRSLRSDLAARNTVTFYAANEWQSFGRSLAACNPPDGRAGGYKTPNTSPQSDAGLTPGRPLGSPRTASPQGRHLTIRHIQPYGCMYADSRRPRPHLRGTG